MQQSITDSKATGLLLLVLVPAQQSTSAAESSSAPLNGNTDIISTPKEKHKPDVTAEYESSAKSNKINIRRYVCRVQWPRGLRRRSASTRLLRLWVRIRPGSWMSVCCECCVLTDISDSHSSIAEDTNLLRYITPCRPIKYLLATFVRLTQNASRDSINNSILEQ